MFLKNSQISQENTCVGVFLYEIFKNIFVYKTPSVAAYIETPFSWKLRLETSKYFENFLGKHLGWSLFLMKLQFFKKETPVQVFSCEIRIIFKNTFFTEHLQWMLMYNDLTFLIIALKQNLLSVLT